MTLKKKKTARLKREKQLTDLETEGETRLTDLISTMGKKHLNGGIFDDAEHHKVCMQALTEEEEEE